MRALHQLAALWRALGRNARVDADLAEEMRFTSSARRRRTLRARCRATPHIAPPG
jgi:hypothetical protein